MAISGSHPLVFVHVGCDKNVYLKRVCLRWCFDPQLLYSQLLDIPPSLHCRMLRVLSGVQVIYSRKISCQINALSVASDGVRAGGASDTLLYGG